MERSDHNMESSGDEISIKDVALKVRSAVRYLKSKWMIIFVFAIAGALLGLAYSIIKKPVYTAVSTFVLEDGGKAGGLGQYAGLASLAGIDLGGSGGGIFEGDNILELYKSRVMIKKTLLSSYDVNGKSQMLIERYIDFNKLRDKWKKDKQLKNISFSGDPSKFTRKQDSVITDMVETFNKKFLSVVKIDKKLNILKVEVASTDELFAKEFNNKLVETVNNFYAQTKTKKSYQNVLILQKQADSVKRVLGYSISGVASALDAAPNANPAFAALRVPSQKKQVDVQASTAIYSEIVKNLEISKISLRQETPLIQLIDEPVLPLNRQQFGKVKGVVIGGFLTAIAVIFVLILNKILKNLLN